MNLVDAIREAAARAPDSEVLSEQQGAPSHSDELPVASTDPNFPLGPGLNLVRLEVFLTPEQISALLRGAMSSHRSVLTLREAASYLRLHISQLEKLAQEGSIPGFMIEGTWRFLKSTIDEWVKTKLGVSQEDTASAA